MKEKDYINATTLARLMVAADVLKWVDPQGEQETLRYKTAVEAVHWLRDRYFKKVEQ